MIKNELEYKITQEWVKKFTQSIIAMDKDENSKKNDFQRWELNRSALQCHKEKLQAEIDEYETLINCDHCQPIYVKVESLNKLPNALIKARIAAKITQKELADLLGIEEQRVSQYEKTNYQCASFVEIIEVSTVLGVEFETAIIKVDFEEIKTIKQTVEQWHNRNINNPKILIHNP